MNEEFLRQRKRLKGENILFEIDGLLSQLEAFRYKIARYFLLLSFFPCCPPPERPGRH